MVPANPLPPWEQAVRLGHLTAVVSWVVLGGQTLRHSVVSCGLKAGQGMSLGKPSSPQKLGGGGLELGVPLAGG